MARTCWDSVVAGFQPGRRIALYGLPATTPTISDQVIAQFKQKGIRVIKNHTTQKIRRQ